MYLDELRDVHLDLHRNSYVKVFLVLVNCFGFMLILEARYGWHGMHVHVPR